METQYPFTSAYPTIPPRLSADTIEGFAPEVFDFCDRQQSVTIRCGTDLDSELFLAVEAILEGASLGAVLAHVTPSHPATREAKRLLRAAWRRRNDAGAATRPDA